LHRLDAKLFVWLFQKAAFFVTVQSKKALLN